MHCLRNHANKKREGLNIYSVERKTDQARILFVAKLSFNSAEQTAFLKEKLGNLLPVDWPCKKSQENFFRKKKKNRSEFRFT